jgi:nicotinamidase/pyrazinamidase
VQRDFCPGGALAVKNGDTVVPRLNKVIRVAEAAGVPIFYTRDWHPRNHMSFREQGGPWPPHCVQGTQGAEFHPGLQVPADAAVISKGNNPRREAYSGFQGTDLSRRLKALGVDEVFIGGLTTDYCVKESSLDALHDGFAVDVLTDCTKAVNVRPGDGQRALQAARKAGAKLTTSRGAMKRLASTQHHKSSV